MTAAGNAVGNAAGNVSWESLASFVQNELELKAPRGRGRPYFTEGI